MAKSKLVSLPSSNSLALVISAIAILISVISLFQSGEANKIAKSANEIATQGNKIASGDSEFNRISKSKEFADQALIDLQKEGILIEKIKQNSPVKNANDLEIVVDQFEDLGSYFCRQVIDKETIRVKFYYTLNYVCNNDQIYSFYGGYKNGTALLCHEFFPESKLASTATNKKGCPALTSK